jgi:hypothetical protein
MQQYKIQTCPVSFTWKSVICLDLSQIIFHDDYGRNTDLILRYLMTPSQLALIEMERGDCVLSKGTAKGERLSFPCA